MTTAPEDRSEPRTDPDLAHAIADAIADLGAEGDFLARGLLTLLRSLPTVRRAVMSDDQRAFFIKSHSMTEEQLHRAERNVARGALVLKQVDTWMNEAWRTTSVRNAAALLHTSEDELHDAVARGSLLSIRIGDEERIPTWQLSSRVVGGLLPQPTPSCLHCCLVGARQQSAHSSTPAKRIFVSSAPKPQPPGSMMAATRKPSCESSKRPSADEVAM